MSKDLDFEMLQNVVNKDGLEAFATTELCVRNGWYDWFCDDSSLQSRTKPFLPLIRGIRRGGKVDFSWHAWFKGNCPCSGPLYDDFRLSSDAGNEFVITHADKREKRLWSVYRPTEVTKGNDGYEPIASFDRISQLVAWLNAPEGEQ